MLMFCFKRKIHLQNQDFNLSHNNKTYEQSVCACVCVFEMENNTYLAFRLLYNITMDMSGIIFVIKPEKTRLKF